KGASIEPFIDNRLQFFRLEFVAQIGVEILAQLATLGKGETEAVEPGKHIAVAYGQRFAIHRSDSAVEKGEIQIAVLQVGQYLVVGRIELDLIEPINAFGLEILADKVAIGHTAWITDAVLLELIEVIQ